jgi:hypothetical protein
VYREAGAAAAPRRRYPLRVHTADDLRRRSLAELETLYRDAPRGPDPAGLFRGHFLHFIDSPGARRAPVRAIDGLLFRATPFGVDFDRAAWWFVRSSLRAGRFEARLGPSRWRPTDCWQLHYDVSRLPGPIRALLYDEVRPLSSSLLLGLGGIARDRGEGDHFFFALERIDRI